MKKLAIATLALGALATTFVTPASASQPTTPPDRPCSFTSATDPNPEAPEDTQTGYLQGGPILQNGTLTCTIQVGGDSHDDANNGASASATGTNGVTQIPPTLVSYNSPSLIPVYLCTQFTGADDNVTWYWNGSTWTTNGTSPCSLATSAGTDDPIFDPVFALIDTILDLLTQVEKDVIDPAVCPVLATLAGSYGPITINAQGDIFIDGEPFWDCPPYDLFG